MVQKTAILLVVVLIAGMAVVGYIGVYMTAPKPDEQEELTSTPEEEPWSTPEGVIETTAEVLFREYIDNEVATDLKYKGCLLQVLGSITDIGRVPAGYGEYSNRAYIVLSEGVLCFFKDESEIAELSRRQEVIVKGKCEGCPKTLKTPHVFLLGCFLVERTEFQLTGWKVVNRYSYVSTEYESAHQAILSINFTKFGYGINLHLINPEGMEVSTYNCTLEDSEADLFMTAKVNEVPVSGQYTLVVKDPNGDVITTEIFTFVGIKIGISEVSTRTSSGYTGGGIYLMEINFKVKNNGDLPFYATILAATTDEGNQTKEYYFPYGKPYVVLPGEEKTIKAYAGVADRALRFSSSGEKAVVLRLKDGTDKVKYAYSITINV